MGTPSENKLFLEKITFVWQTQCEVAAELPVRRKRSPARRIRCRGSIRLGRFAFGASCLLARALSVLQVTAQWRGSPTGGGSGRSSHGITAARRQDAMLAACSGSLRGLSALTLAWFQVDPARSTQVAISGWPRWPRSVSVWRLAVSSARGRALRAGSAGVLGGSRSAWAAGSSPVASDRCAFPCCCGLLGSLSL